MNRTITGLVLAGLALLAPPAVADEEHEVDGRCEFASLAHPNSNATTTTVVGRATATHHDPAVATGVRCVLKNAFSGAVLYDGTQVSPGPVAVLADTAAHPAAAITVCASALALWGDGHSTQTALVCTPPF